MNKSRRAGSTPLESTHRKVAFSAYSLLPKTTVSPLCRQPPPIFNLSTEVKQFSSGWLYASIAGYEEHEGAVDEKARSYYAKHVRAQRLT